MFYHYTYLIRNNLNKKKYIGVRTSKCLPENDNYWGSCKTLTESIARNGSCSFKKRVLAIWDTRREAVVHEITLHKKYDVAKNSKFYNKAHNPKKCQEWSELRSKFKWYNNGITTKMCIPGTEPRGFVLGRKLS